MAERTLSEGVAGQDGSYVPQQETQEDRGAASGEGTIPIYKPDLSGKEKQYVADCLESGWISSKGKYVQQFEEAFGEFVGASYCCGVCNGTAAIQTAIGALKIGLGDEVIVPSLTYIASVNPVVGAGATPVFVDSRPDTWQMDPADVERKITSRTRAILAVHLYGGMCDTEALAALAKKHGLWLIEDCAEAFGSRLKGTAAGSFGDVAAFSFYGNKTITTGEGGMVVARTPELMECVRAYRGQGVSPSREYWHETLGFNYRLTNVAAAIGLAQLERAREFIDRKRRLAGIYREALADVPVTFQAVPEGVFHTWWMVSLLAPSAQQLPGLRKALTAAGVETRPLFPPVHAFPMYCRAGERFPVAEDLAARGLNLPSWPGLTDTQVRYVADVIRRHLAST